MLVVVLDVRPKDYSWLTWVILFQWTGKDVHPHWLISLVSLFLSIDKISF